MLVERSLQFSNDYFNGKDISGNTPFHSACEYGRTKVAEKLMEKSDQLNIDLNAKGPIHKLHQQWTVDLNSKMVVVSLIFYPQLLDE